MKYKATRNKKTAKTAKTATAHAKMKLVKRKLNSFLKSTPRLEVDEYVDLINKVADCVETMEPADIQMGMSALDAIDSAMRAILGVDNEAD